MAVDFYWSKVLRSLFGFDVCFEVVVVVVGYFFLAVLLRLVVACSGFDVDGRWSWSDRVGKRIVATLGEGILTGEGSVQRSVLPVSQWP